MEGNLPTFSLSLFMESVNKGMEERERSEEEERMQRTKIREEMEQERDEKAAFWTTSRLRPLAEPPILDWDWFFRLRMPSDIRFKALFPDDPESRARMKDLAGEKAVLTEYIYCQDTMRSDSKTEDVRRTFHENLQRDLYEEWKEVDKEYKETWAMATELGQWEYRNLDQDGGTNRVEEWIKKGADIFRNLGDGDEVREKYRYLVPLDFVHNRLATFEFCWLDPDTAWSIARYVPPSDSERMGGLRREG